MNKYLLFLPALALLSACGTVPNMLKTAEQDPKIPVTLTELDHTHPNDQVLTVSGFIPFPSMDVSATGATSYGYGGDIRWRSLRLGEAQLTLNNRSIVDLGTIQHHPSDGTKNILQFNATYRYPFRTWQKDKLTKAWTTLHGFDGRYNLSYYMLHQSPVFRSWNIRAAVQNDLAGCKTEQRARIQEHNLLFRVGVSLSSSQYLTFKGNHTSMGDFRGNRFRHWELYADVSALLHSSVSDVRYRYTLSDGNVTYEDVDMKPFLQKQPIGLSVGYYVESYPSPEIRFLMLSFRSEIGVRPGYFTKFSDAVFIRFAFGIGFNLFARGR